MDIFITHEMHNFLAMAVGSTLLILIAGSNVGFTGRGFWSMAVGCVLGGVGIVCIKALD
jgi:hypothetical protein